MALKNLNNFKDDIIEEENVIIGSGAGGSTTAFELLKKKKSSIILEEGPDINSIDKSNIGKSIVQLYKNNGATPLYSFNGGPLIGYGQGSCVGGSTYVNAGYYSNTPEWVFNDWIKNNRTNISYSNFQNLLNQIKSEMKINTEDLSTNDNDSKFLLDRSNQIKWKIEKCERFSSGKIDEEKENMNNTYHKKIFKDGIDIVHDCKVDKIIVKNNEAKIVEAVDKKSNKKYKFKFKNLFVNCGPINSPHLLIRNKLIKYENGQNNFEFHINFKIIVKFKNGINPNFTSKFNPDLPVSVFFVREFEKEGTLLSAANSEIPYLLATTSHFNDKIKKDLYSNFENYAMYVYQIKSKSFGQVKNIFGIPYVNYEYNKEDYSEIKKAIERTSKFFLEGGADFVLFPVENSTEIRTVKDSKNLIDNLKMKKLHLVSVHGMSSLRAGEEKGQHTDYLGKLRKFKNIYVNDASILPGNTGESPQASIMAFAKHNVQNNNY